MEETGKRFLNISVQEIYIRQDVDITITFLEDFFIKIKDIGLSKNMKSFVKP